MNNMRYCQDCEITFKEKDAKWFEYDAIEPNGKGEFAWSELKTVKKKIDACPNCEGLRHACVLQVEDYKSISIQVTIGSLMLSPSASKKRCEELYKNWIKETFKNK